MRLPRHMAVNFQPLRQHRGRGFTIIELMITITLATILVTIAAPSFKNFITNQRVKTASSDLFFTLTLARSEAIKRNTQVTITKATNGWQDGWKVAAGTDTLSTQNSYTGITVTASASSVTYGNDGRLTSATSPTFQVSSDTQSRCVSVDLTGLPKSKTGSC